MKIAPRIYVPVITALIASAGIGASFLWQIRSTVFTIESTFKTPLVQSNFLKKLVYSNPDDRLSSVNQSMAILKLRQGEIFELKGNWKQAEKLYQESVDAGGGTLSLRKLAVIQLQRREYDAAQNTVKRLKEENPENDETVFLEGMLYLNGGDIERARAVFSSQTSPQAHFGLALIAISKEEFKLALTELKTVNQGDDPVMRTYAQNIEKAFSEYSLFPEGQTIHLQTLIAHALARINQCETALPILNRVIGAQEKYRDAWIVKGFCEFTTERLKESISSLEKAYSLDPEKPETQYFMARAYAASGDPQNAVTYLQYALLNGFSPEDDARELLAEYARELGNTELALEQYGLLAESNDSGFDAFERYVNLAVNSPNRSLDALSQAKKALVRWPDDPDVLALAAKAAEAAGLPDDANKYIEKALKLDPKNPKALELDAAFKKTSEE